MPKNKKRGSSIKISLPQATRSDLRGRQSVRATFRLTEGCIDAISVVSRQLGIKQKSLFDHLVEDIELLESIAIRIANSDLTKQNRIQKTFVISRRSLLSLDKIARAFGAPRDMLVEYSVQRLLPLIEKEQQKHRKRKEFLKSIEVHFKAGKKLLDQIEETLGNDDPMLTEFLTTMAVYQSTMRKIASFVEKGKIIEEFDLESFKEKPGK